MKKKTVLALLVTVLTVCLCFASCVLVNNTTYEIKADKTMVLEKGEKQTLEYTVTANGQIVTDVETTVTINGESVAYSADTNEITAVKSGISKITIALKDDASVKAEITVNVPGYTIEFNKESMSIALGESAPLVYTVKKDGAKVTNVKVKLTVEGDAITANELTKTVTAKKVGTATLIATLENDESVYDSIEITVKDTFFNRDEATRGDIDFSQEDSGLVKVNGGQATVTVKEASTKFVFKTTINIKSTITSDTSVGIGSFYDEGNHALWFGLRGTNKDGVYDVYIRDFYDSWGSPAFDSTGIGNYNGYQHGMTVELIIVRDGDDYWYSLGGLTGYYHDKSGNNTNEATFPGIYSQEKMLEITEFSVAYTDEAVEEAKNELSAKVAKIVITNGSNTLLSAGTRFQYNAIVYSSEALTESIVWTLDKSEMTAGQDGTTIENGALTLANDAAGYVTVTASCGGKEVSVRVEITSEKLDQSSDNVSVSGGVQLDKETDKITFPENRNFNNETLDLTQYVEVPYMAKLLSTIKGDFTLTFKVKNYKGNALLVSLGGAGNNFVIGNGIVTGYTYNVGTDGSWTYGKDGNASVPVSGFDAAAEHTYVISVVGGKYTVSVDGTELKFAAQAIRRAEDYIADTNIMFTTQAGTSCEVYDISLESKGSTLGDWYIYSGNATESNGSLTATTPALGNNGWDGKDFWITKYAYINDLIPTGNFSVKVSVKFNGTASDTKAVFCIGNYEFHLCNKLSSDNIVEAEYYNGNWGGGKKTIPGGVDDTYIVEIKRIGNDVYFYVNDVLVNKHSGMTAGNMLYFYTFNGNAADASNTVVVSDVKIYDSVLNLTGSSSVEAGESATYEAGVTDAAWTLNTDGLTAGTATLENGVLSLSKDAKGTLVITATVGDYSQSLTVKVKERDTNQDKEIVRSENNNLTVNGNSFTLAFQKQQWIEQETLESVGTFYNRDIMSGDIDITFKVSFSDAMQDAKLGIWMGSEWTATHEFDICVGNGSYKAEIRNVWGGVSTSDWDITNISVKLQVRGDKVTMIINDNYTVGTVDLTGDRTLGFYLFNETQGDIGKTVTVSDISIEKNEIVRSENDNLTVNGNSFTLAFQKQEWIEQDTLKSVGTFYNRDIMSGDIDITFKVSFSDAMQDAKLGIWMGSEWNAAHEFDICVGDSYKAEIRNVWGGQAASGWDITNLSVKLQVRGDKVTMIINDDYTVGTVDLTGDRTLGFYLFNNTQGDIGKTVTISDISITAIA